MHPTFCGNRTEIELLSDDTIRFTMLHTLQLSCSRVDFTGQFRRIFHSIHYIHSRRSRSPWEACQLAFIFIVIPFYAFFSKYLVLCENE